MRNEPYFSAKQKELRAVLDFMYNGEVSVSQDSLNNFLSAAEELAVKGLTANDALSNTQTNLDEEPQVRNAFKLKKNCLGTY